MPKFLVTKSVDAFVNYSAIVEAENASEARQKAEDEDRFLAWHETSVTDFDETDFDNIEPEAVADDFTLEPAEDLTAELLAALKDAWELLPPRSPADPEMSRYDKIRAAIAKATS